MTEAKVWLERVREQERRSELLAAYDIAVQGLEEHPDDQWLSHRAILNLAKSGATGRADTEFKRLGLQRSTEPDIAALGARIAKDRAVAATGHERGALLQRAAALYNAIYARKQHYYPGINAATLRLLSGDTERARGLALQLLENLRSPPQGEATEQDEEAYYRAASEAEAALILGDMSAVRNALARAAALPGDLAARAATRRQLRLICKAQGIDEAVLAGLAPPAVLAYTGHIISAPGVDGRFLAAQEEDTAAAIKALLDKHNIGFGYGALAAGADILFAEALLARKAELHVVLPFTRDEFVEVSVAPAQADWRQRFDSCLERATRVTFATDDHYLGHDSIFNYGSGVAMGLAVLRARFLDAEVMLGAVWDGKDAAGHAGTAADVRTWQALGRRTDVIWKEKTPRAQTVAKEPEGAKGQRELRAMLFGDIKGFSKLTEEQIPIFVTHILGTIGRVLESYGDKVLFRNTWGDGIYVVLSDTVVAARCALELQTALAKVELDKYRLPDTLTLRLGGHYGPVFEMTDPVVGVTGYFGAHVSRTARIEPVTPPGEVYVTEQFAARLALEPAGYDCHYVGRVPAAKDFGTLRMYHLQAL